MLREKEADPEDRDNDRGNRQEEGAEVKEEPTQGSQQGKDKGKGSDDYFNIIFIVKPPSYLSTYILPCLPGDINVAND